MAIPVYIEKKYFSGTTQFSYCLENYGSPLGNDVVDDLIDQAFSLWTSAQVPVDFYRKDNASAQCDIVLCFLSTSDSRYTDVFGNLSSDTLAGARDEQNRVSIYIKDSINVLGITWNKDLFSRQLLTRSAMH